MPSAANALPRRADAPCTPPRKPLYLFASAPAMIDASGEVLVLRRASAPVQRFPLARVARIICNRHASWTGTALALCLGEGVTITWVDGHGRAIGHSQPRQPRPDAFATLIETYLELPDWPQRFANWRARRRLETLTTCAQRAADAGHGVTPERFAALKHTYVYGGAIELAFAAEGEAWCHALTVDRLHREGLQARYLGFDASALDLGTELATLLWAELNLDCGSLSAGADGTALRARLFESWAHQREHRLLHHLGDFKRHLAREVQAWH